MGVLPRGLDDFNVFIMKVSPPDRDGMVNFGDIQIMSKLQARHAELVIAEIDPSLVRIGGDNSMHISQIDWFVEPFPDAQTLPGNLPAVSKHEKRTMATIFEMVTCEIIPGR